MLNSKLTSCKEGGDISDLLKRINCKLAELSNDMYNNIAFMLNNPIPTSQIIELLTYREILENKQVNSEYTKDYSVEDIAGKVIRLTAGCKLRCPKVNTQCITTTNTTTVLNCEITSATIECLSCEITSATILCI